VRTASAITPSVEESSGAFDYPILDAGSNRLQRSLQTARHRSRRAGRLALSPPPVRWLRQMDDPAMRMSSLAAELILACIRIAIETHSLGSQPVDRFPRALGDVADRDRIAQAAPASMVSAKCDSILSAESNTGS
jgi:hypothetical protein